MALNVVSPDYTGTGPAASLAAPTVSETVDVSGGTVFLLVVIGATATTITIPVGPKDAFGRTQTSITSGALTSTTRVLRLTRDMADPTTGLVTVQFSQVTNVTAVALRP